MPIRQSSFRNLHWTPSSSTPKLSIDGGVSPNISHHMAISPTILATTASQSSGGKVTLYNIQPELSQANSVSIQAHGTAAINALEFSPFDQAPHALATGSTDQTIKIWKVPQTLNSTIEVSISSTISLQKPVIGISFHPSAHNILAANATTRVSAVDIKSGKETIRSTHPDTVTSIAWARNGSIISTFCKDKSFRLLDLRVSEDASTTIPNAHSGRKPAAGVFVSDTHLLSTGFSAAQEREVKLWDLRDLTSPLKRIRIDANTGVLTPMYDADTSLVFLSGRGDASIRYYELSLSSSPYLHAINQSGLSEPSLTMGMAPKAAVDGLNCEVVRIYNLTSKFIEPMEFKVPRREAPATFQQDLYPPTASMTQAALSAEDFFLNKNSPPVLEPVTELFFKKSFADENVVVVGAPANTKEAPNKSGGGWNTGSGWGGDDDDAVEKTESHQEVVVPAAVTVADIQVDTAPKSDTNLPVKSNSSTKLLASSSSKKQRFKYLQGSEGSKSEAFFNVPADVTSSLVAPLLSANESYWACAITGGGGPVYVRALSDTGKVETTNSGVIVNGHSQPVIDLQLSHHQHDLLVTGSEDCSINLWRIPNDNGKQLLKEDALANFTGHTRGVRTINFHPIVENIVVSSSVDQTIRVWDLVASAEAVNIPVGGGDVLNVDFNFDGSLVATTCRDRVIRVFDPRSAANNAAITSGVGAKSQRIVWCHSNSNSSSDGSYLFTTGFGAQSERQFSFWDVRKLSDPLSVTKIDSSGSALFPLYDASSNIIYLAGKGSTSIVPYEVNLRSGDSPLATACDGFHTLSAPLCGAVMLPKHMCDIRGIEVSKFLVLSQSSVTPVSFSLPRADKLKTYFQDDVYGPIIEGDSADVSSSEWLSGINACPNLESCQPDGMIKLSEKPEETEKLRPKVVDFKEKMDLELREKQVQEENFSRMQALANQRAIYHPNHSMGIKGVDAARVEDSDDSSDGGWDD